MITNEKLGRATDTETVPAITQEPSPGETAIQAATLLGVSASGVYVKEAS